MVFLSFLTLFFDRQSGFKALLYKVKAAGKREQRKSLLLLCRAGAGSSARSAVKGESGKVKTCANERNAKLALAFYSECS
jgi:hypothetical protein